jgi:acyl-CoA synthetase (AMP-forming)/AMP-acid ligase II
MAWTAEETRRAVETLPPRISHIIRRWAAERPEHLAVTEAEATLTYGELAHRVGEMAARLREWGVRPGDRLMLVGENCIALAVSILAASEADAWPVIVNARLSPRELDAIQAHCGARRVLYAVGVSPHASQHAARRGAETVSLPGIGSLAVGPLDPDVLPEPVEGDGARQVAALIYTTGTTGRPKGVMLTHRNVLFIAAVSGGLRRLGPEDRVYGVLPVSHVFGLSSVFLGSLLNGSTLLLRPRFDPADLVATLERDRLTVLQGVPAMFARLIEHLRTNHLEAIARPALRYVSAGGSPLDHAVKTATERVLGLPLNNGYGLTECAPTIAQTLIEAPRDDCSVGPILPGIEACLRDLGGGPAQGEVGELWVRGPTVMKGYYRAPEETHAVVDGEGWLNTGDLARFDAEGNLFIVGRSKELIIRSGFNVYPPEVEAVLNAHPDVTQSAVVGRRVDGNEEVVAFVELAPGSVADASDLASFAADRLAPYKRPTEIRIVEAMPAGSTGKILKHELARLASSGP